MPMQRKHNKTTILILVAYLAPHHHSSSCSSENHTVFVLIPAAHPYTNIPPTPPLIMYLPLLLLLFSQCSFLLFNITRFNYIDRLIYH